MKLNFDFTKEQIASIGRMLRSKFELASADRVILEQQWLKNLRQYRKKYDPEIEKLIPQDRSKVYTGDTFTKVNGFIAKMMEMMFPASEVNFEVEPTKCPSINQKDLQNIIDGLRADKAQQLQAQMQAQGESLPINPQLTEPTSEEIELAVRSFAKDRAINMQDECLDQLEENDYTDLSKRALRSGAIYGFGVTEGPTITFSEERLWDKQPDGTYKAVTKKLPRPVYAHRNMWDLYPDLVAKKWHDMEYMFDRRVFTRSKLAALRERKDFISEAIDEYLSINSDGNYKSRAYEIELNIIKLTNNLNKRDARRYEVVRYFGFLNAHELRDAGIMIPEEQMAENILVDFWLLDSTPIKAQMAAFGEKPSDIYHAYIHTDDEDSGLTGLGMPEILRDSQMSRCAIRRMIMDNSAAVAGPIFTYDESKLARGKEIPTFHSFATIAFDSDDAPNFQMQNAVHQLSTDAHIVELLEVERELKSDVDIESAIPSWTLGDAKPLGEGFRTSQNMSQMTGGANVILKDNVRAFDRYTESLVGSLVKWNMDSEFNKKEEIKGDFQVQAKGTISLVAKEVQGSALDQLAMTLSPQERQYVDTRKLLVARVKSRDLDVDIVKSEKECQQIDAQNQQMASAQADMENQVTQAKAQSLSAKAMKDQTDAKNSSDQNQSKIAEIISRINMNISTAKSNEDRNALEQAKVLLENLITPEQNNAQALSEETNPRGMRSVLRRKQSGENTKGA